MNLSIAVTNPQRRRIDGRRMNNRRRWKDPRWHQMKKEHIIPESICVHCGYHDGEQRRDREGNPRTYIKGPNAGKPIIVHLTINHKDRDSYRSDDEYLTWDPEKMEVCCTTCNGKIENGMKPCPICHVNYIHWTAEMCPVCRDERDPEGAKIRQASRERYQENLRENRNTRSRNKRDKQRKAAHPCLKRGLEQRCLRGSGMVCQYPAKKCLDEKKGCPWLKKNPQWLREAVA